LFSNNSPLHHDNSSSLHDNSLLPYSQDAEFITPIYCETALPRCFAATERVWLYFRRCKLTMLRFRTAMDRCNLVLLRHRAEMRRCSIAMEHCNRVRVVTSLQWGIATQQWCIAPDFGSLHRNNGALQLNNGALQHVLWR
jgi:hypothetical protein